MEKIYADNAASIGNTPLVKLNNICKGLEAEILLKIEGRNPAYSVKCRVGVAMVADAEKRGLLQPGGTIVEPTSGNTGIALAFVAAAKGYRLILTMPETMSQERRKVLKAFGAELVLTPGELRMAGAIAEAEKIVQNIPGSWMPMQFKNPANPKIHEETTGPEIWRDTGGRVDLLVCGVGTGGTLSGSARFLKQMNPSLQAIAVEPKESAVITQTLAGEKLKPGAHKIQGIGAGFIPETLDLAIVDRVICITGEEAMEKARELAREEGIFAGISSGAAVAAALQLAALPENKGKRIVAISPDAGERYLSSELFE